jgi:hypothetical protein
MHISYNPEIFRRNPKLGIGLGLILLCIALGGFHAEYSDYRTLGRAPQEMTFEQAVPSPSDVPDGPRWVSLPGGLTPLCNHVLQEMTSGVPIGTRVLASDTSQRWFYVRLKGDVDCRAAASPMVGILQKADSGLPAWLKDKGISVPASSYPLMEISVGETPGDVVTLLWIFGGMGVLGLVTIVVFARMKPSYPARPMTRAAGVGGR